MNVDVCSPLSPASLVDLYFRPSAFFKNTQRLLRWPELLLVSWAIGVVDVLGRIDRKIMQSEFAPNGVNAASLEWITKSWLGYWATALMVGAVSAGILWYLGGWWYRLRLEWSGASDVPRRTARSMWAYQSLVMAGPMLTIACVQTLAFPSYEVAWRADEFWSSVALIFAFWSCITSYKAVTSVFPLSLWKARFWFLILPIVVYLASMGVIAWLYALS